MPKEPGAGRCRTYGPGVSGRTLLGGYVEAKESVEEKERVWKRGGGALDRGVTLTRSWQTGERKGDGVRGEEEKEEEEEVRRGWSANRRGSGGKWRPGHNELHDTATIGVASQDTAGREHMASGEPHQVSQRSLGEIGKGAAQRENLGGCLKLLKTAYLGGENRSEKGM
jgi:hypothetical protein